MKLGITVFILLLLPFATHAEQDNRAAGEAMQQMMMDMEKMQKCMQTIDIKKLELLEKKSKAIEAEVHQLCQAGRVKKAFEIAKAFAEKMKNDATLIAINECSKSISHLGGGQDFLNEEILQEGMNICDEFSQ
ncbi:MAG: hypothetical protein OEY38_06025 [Gammaproteobacteria bacterium]|nr:hypothetical protein [Gammaproteobacteria bacterium]